MKPSIKVAMLCSMALLSVKAMAMDGTIDFVGDINDNTCSVSVNDGNGSSTVQLGSVQASSLSNAGDIAGGASFTLSISDTEGSCDLTGKTGTVRFTTMSGTAGDKQQYLGLKSGDDTATNVAIRITDDKNEIVSIGTQSSQSYDLSQPISFNANYVATGKATSGKADAKAGFVIDYK